MGNKVRQSANGQPCALRLVGCDLTGTTVLAHLRTIGVGAGRKPDDSMALYACSPCHDVIDGRSSNGMMEKEIQERMLKGLAETHRHLISEGLMVLK